MWRAFTLKKTLAYVPLDITNHYLNIDQGHLGTIILVGGVTYL